MEQHIKNSTDRLENILLTNSTDFIPFLGFVTVSMENEWGDYVDSAIKISEIFGNFGYKDLLIECVVSSSHDSKNKSKIEYLLMFDEKDKLYLALSIIHDMEQNAILCSIYEYNAEIAESDDIPAYQSDRLIGYFFLDYPIVNQQFSEEFKKTSYRIKRLLEKSRAYN